MPAGSAGSFPGGYGPARLTVETSQMEKRKVTIARQVKRERDGPLVLWARLVEAGVEQRLSKTEIRVFDMLAAYGGKDGSFPAVSTIQEVTGYERRTVFKALARLKALKVIVAVGRVPSRYHNVPGPVIYQFNTPSELSLEEVPCEDTASGSRAKREEVPCEDTGIVVPQDTQNCLQRTAEDTASGSRAKREEDREQKASDSEASSGKTEEERRAEVTAHCMRIQIREQCDQWRWSLEKEFAAERQAMLNHVKSSPTIPGDREEARKLEANVGRERKAPAASKERTEEETLSGLRELFIRTGDREATRKLARQAHHPEHLIDAVLGEENGRAPKELTCEELRRFEVQELFTSKEARPAPCMSRRRGWRLNMLREYLAITGDREKVRRLARQAGWPEEDLEAEFGKEAAPVDSLEAEVLAVIPEPNFGVDYSRRCEAVTRAGLACVGRPLNGSPFCRYHQLKEEKVCAPVG
jgi:hypothetical protein